MEKNKEEKERKEKDGGQQVGRSEKKRKRRRRARKDKAATARNVRKPRRKRTSFDTAIKANLEPCYPDLIHWLLRTRPSKVSPLDPNLPVIRCRGADKLLRLRFKDRPPFLAHIEFQTRSDPNMPERMAEYLILIHRLRKRLKYRKSKFYCVVIYLSPKAFRGDPGRLVIEGVLGTRLEYTYNVVKLWEKDPRAVLKMKAPGLLPFLPFMAGNQEELTVKSAKKIRDAPDSLISPERKGELFQVMGTLISGVVEDQKMRQRLLEKLSRDKDNPFVKLVREQGRAEGKAEGRAEGKAEGAVESARSDVLEALECRFGQLSRDIVEQVGRIASLKKLKTLHRKAILTPSIEAFLESLK